MPWSKPMVELMLCRLSLSWRTLAYSMVVSASKDQRMGIPSAARLKGVELKPAVDFDVAAEQKLRNQNNRYG